MKINLADRIKSLSFLNLVFIITALMLLSFLPIVEIEEYNNGKSLYVNLFSIDDSNNLEIQEIAEKLYNVTYLIWSIIILSLILIFGVIVELSEEYTKFSKLLLLFGIPIPFISLLAVYCYHNNISYITEAKTLSMPYLFEPIRYSYIPTFFLIIVMLCSIFCLIALTKFFNGELKKYKKKNKKNIKEEIKKKRAIPKKLEKNLKRKEKKSKEETKSVNEKDRKEEMENWLNEETKKIDTNEEEQIELALNKKSEQETPTENKKQQSVEKDTKAEGKIILENKEKKSKEETKIDRKETVKSDGKIVDLSKKSIKNEGEKEIPNLKETEKSLDEALEDAIKKRELDKTNKETDIKEKKESEKYKIKCPQCNHIFAIDKKEGKNKTKCPKCGKEGIVEL